MSRRYDVNANLIFRWIKAGEAKAEKKQKLIPVGIVGPSSMAPLKQEQPLSLSAASPKLIEIELGSGTKVRIDGEVRLPVLQCVLKMLRGLA